MFLNFTLEFIIKCFFFGKVREHIVLDQLLCKSTGTFGEITTSCNADYCGTGNTLQIYTVVFVKTLILNRNKSMLQIFRYLINGFVYPVGTGRYKSFNFCAAVIGVDESGKSFRFNVRCGDMRSIINDLFYKKTAAGYSDYCCKNNTDSNALNKRTTIRFPCIVDLDVIFFCLFAAFFFP